MLAPREKAAWRRVAAGSALELPPSPGDSAGLLPLKSSQLSSCLIRKELPASAQAPGLPVTFKSIKVTVVLLRQILSRVFATMRIKREKLDVKPYSVSL